MAVNAKIITLNLALVHSVLSGDDVGVVLGVSFYMVAVLTNTVFTMRPDPSQLPVFLKLIL